MNAEESTATVAELASLTKAHTEHFLRGGICGEIVGVLVAVASVEAPAGVDVRDTVTERLRHLIREFRIHAAACRGCT